MTSIYIGQDKKFTLSSLAFNGVAATSGATVTWTLYNASGTQLATGSGSFVSSGTFRFTVQSSDFSDQAPAAGSNYRLGRLHVTASQDGADGSFGDTVSFEYPQLTAS